VKSIPILVFSFILSARTTHRKHSRSIICVAQTTQKTSDAITISPVHWLADCCLATSYKHSSYFCVTLSEKVFIAPLPSYIRYNKIHPDTLTIRLTLSYMVFLRKSKSCLLFRSAKSRPDCQFNSENRQGSKRGHKVLVPGRFNHQERRHIQATLIKPKK
jgi:hypothetical protein